MNQIELYFDEDATYTRLVLVTALRPRGVTVVTVMDAGLTAVSDEEQLAPSLPRVTAGREHAGIILAPRQRFSVGEQLRCILRLRASATRTSMRNQVQFLSNWP